MSAERVSIRKVFVGQVVKDKMDKTRIVSMERNKRHPAYGKVVYRTSTVFAHDEKNETKVGDWVEIMETRPLSKNKRWLIEKIVKKGT